MTTEKNAAPAKTEEQAMQYSDEPQFTVAGVTEPSNVGGHGSNVTLPTKEALARETASLGVEGTVRKDATAASDFTGELPKVAAGDFGQNLKVGRDLLQAGRAKQAIAYLEQAVRLRPMDYDAGYSLAVDRKSTRLNSSHQIISYAVFCFKKKKIRASYDDNA